MTEGSTMHVTMDIEYLEFAKCRAFQRVHHKTVTITNHTRVNMNTLCLNIFSIVYSLGWLLSNGPLDRVV